MHIYMKSFSPDFSPVMLNPQGVLLPVEIPELAELQQRVASCKQLAAGARHLLQVAPTQRSTIAQLKVLQVRGCDPDRSSRVGVSRTTGLPRHQISATLSWISKPMIRTETYPPPSDKGIDAIPRTETTHRHLIRWSSPGGFCRHLVQLSSA